MYSINSKQQEPDVLYADVVETPYVHRINDTAPEEEPRSLTRYLELITEGTVLPAIFEDQYKALAALSPLERQISRLQRLEQKKDSIRQAAADCLSWISSNHYASELRQFSQYGGVFSSYHYYPINIAPDTLNWLIDSSKIVTQKQYVNERDCGFVQLNRASSNQAILRDLNVPDSFLRTNFVIAKPGWAELLKHRLAEYPAIRFTTLISYEIFNEYFNIVLEKRVQELKNQNKSDIIVPSVTSALLTFVNEKFGPNTVVRKRKTG